LKCHNFTILNVYYFYFQYKHDPDFVAFLEAEGKTKVLDMIRNDLDSGCEDEDDTEEKNEEETEKEVKSVAHAPISDSEVSETLKIYFFLNYYNLTYILFIFSVFENENQGAGNVDRKLKS
jgi:hypothetical protein